jgi:adenylate cyclase
VAERHPTRRLAAILAADIAGYSRLTERDEEATVARLQALREELIDPALAAHRGRLVKTTGDGLLAEFASVVDAVRCGMAMQHGLAARNAGIDPARRIEFRIGIHLGDVLVAGDDLMGDGVNVAARLESIAPPGGICLSEDAWRQVDGKVTASFTEIGAQNLKNIARPVRAYRIETVAGGAFAQTEAERSASAPASIAVLPFTNMSGDPEQDYFADGVVEDIITGLSRIRWLFVIARNSSFVYKAAPST